MSYPKSARAPQNRTALALTGCLLAASACHVGINSNDNDDDNSAAGKVRDVTVAQAAPGGGTITPTARTQPIAGQITPTCAVFSTLCNGADCCRANTTCGAPGTCQVPVSPDSRVCPIGLGMCSSGRCCPPGTICDGSKCKTFGDLGNPPCATGSHQCNLVCCPSDQSCGTGGGCDVPSTASVAATPCGSGYCPAGATCDGSLCTFPADPPTTTGKLCDDGGFCPGVFPTCLDGGQCCDGTMCGSECCASGMLSLCVDVGGVSTCGCQPYQGPACGDRCCAPGQGCVAGLCGATCDPDYPTLCGDSCCAPDVDCVANECVCPEEHPVMCGDDCCLPGAACLIDTCGCPPGETECGDLCCAVGKTCSGGRCVTGSSSGDTCSSNSECDGFGGRNCGGSDYARCADDSLCHCCVQLCSGSSCVCQSCSGACGGPPQTMCADDGTCIFSVGGTPNQ